MQKRTSHIGVIAMVTILAVILFTACKKECSDCVPRTPDVVEKISFNLMEQSMITEMSINQGYMNNYYREAAFTGNVAEQLFQYIKAYCISNNITINDQAIAFMLYYSEPLSQSLSVDKDKIQGVSFYQVEGKKIMHHLFLKNDKSEFCEIENIKVAVPGVYPDQIDFYLEYYVFTDPQNRSAIFISGNFEQEFQKKRRKYRGTPVKYEINARKDIIRDHSETKFIDLNLMYSFSDVSLSQSKIGQAYIGNYYCLSEEYNGKITISLAVKTALFFKDFNPVMKVFSEPEKHLTEVPFDDKLSKSLLELIDQYEKITNSADGKEILASIRKDINMFRNKKLNEILAMIE